MYEPLWRKIRELCTSKNLDLHLTWVRAHGADHPLLVDVHGLDPTHVTGNACADALAGRAADFAEVTKQEATNLLWLQALVQKVQYRLLAIMLILLDEHSVHRARPATTVPRPVVNLAVEALKSSHQVVMHAQGASCAACHAHFTGPRHLLAKWLSTPCRGFAPDLIFGTRHVPLPPGYTVQLRGVRVHPSHKLWYYRGFYYCTQCCAISATMVRHLGSACTMLKSRSGQEKVKRLWKGKPPTARYLWPSDKATGEVTLVL